MQVFVDEASQEASPEASQETRVVGLKSLGALVDATVQYIDGMAREGVPVDRIFGYGAGEQGGSVTFLKMLADRSIKKRSLSPRSPQRNGIAEKPIQ